MDISDRFKNFGEKVVSEFSYLTGIGWNYKPDSEEKSFAQRKEERTNVSKNNILICSDFRIFRKNYLINTNFYLGEK